MRVLLLARDPERDLGWWIDGLESELARRGFYAKASDASAWMPRETDPRQNDGTARRLRELGDGFDLVHAFGYRAAFACSTAFADREVWGYTAWGAPKTLHKELIRRLNDAEFGTCPYRSLRTVLEQAGTNNLHVIYPGVEPAAEGRNRLNMRASLGLADEFVVGMDSGDDGFELAVEAIQSVPYRRLLLIGEERTGVLPPEVIAVHGARPREYLQACDLWLSADSRPHFDLGVLDAMAMQLPVLARSVGSGLDVVAEDVTGLLFGSDDELAPRLGMIQDMELSREAYGQAGRVRFEERFTIERSAQAFCDLYETAS